MNKDNDITVVEGIVTDSLTHKYGPLDFMEGWYIRSKAYGKWSAWHKCGDPCYDPGSSKITFSYPDKTRLQYRLFKRIDITDLPFPEFKAPRGGITYGKST